MTMKHIIIIFSLFIGCASICAAPAYGEQESPFSNVNPSAQQAASGSSYSSTVYQPFNNTTPAEYSASGMNSTDGYNPSYVHGPRKGKIDGPDTKPDENDFPVGEPWVMLAFAALAAGVIAYNRKKSPTQAKN
jgi:hypothetical protein